MILLLLKPLQIDFQSLEKNFIVWPEGEIVINDGFELAFAEAVRMPGINHGIYSNE